jgi:hypothetical protein
MVQRITDVLKEYQTKLCQLPFIRRPSFRRDSMGYCGDVNTFFHMTHSLHSPHPRRHCSANRYDCIYLIPSIFTHYPSFFRYSHPRSLLPSSATSSDVAALFVGPSFHSASFISLFLRIIVTSATRFYYVREF